jgi:hypothetical protein
MKFVYKVRFSFCFVFCFIKEYLCHINYDRGITTLFQLSIYLCNISILDSDMHPFQLLSSPFHPTVLEELDEGSE